jgi:hypothetical protein
MDDLNDGEPRPENFFPGQDPQRIESFETSVPFERSEPRELVERSTGFDC